jgi:hypothetical protein
MYWNHEQSCLIRHDAQLVIRQVDGDGDEVQGMTVLRRTQRPGSSLPCPRYIAAMAAAQEGGGEKSMRQVPTMLGAIPCPQTRVGYSPAITHESGGSYPAKPTPPPPPPPKKHGAGSPSIPAGTWISGLQRSLSSHQLGKERGGGCFGLACASGRQG